MRKLYVGTDKSGNGVVYVETENGVYNYHPDLGVFVKCLLNIEQLTKIFNLEMKRELKKGEKVSNIVHYAVSVA